MEEKIKVLVCGDVEGKFNSLFAKVESINKKAGPFDVLLCVGNFFGINNTEFEPYKNGFKKIPIQTYILGPNKGDHINFYPSNEEENELCTNLHYLGKRGLYTTTSGLKIAYMSGVSIENEAKEFNFTSDDAIALRDVCVRGNSNFRGVDILITSQWPCNVTLNTNQNFEMATASYQVAWLATQLKPRYHFVGMEGAFYERAPYRNMDGSDLMIATRFIALARVANAKKAKWLYALSLTPVERMKIGELLQKTTDETPTPYDLHDLDAKMFKRKRKSLGGDDAQQYFYDMSQQNDNDGQRKSKGGGKRPKIVFDQSKCWFCLASPSVEKHLVITVGTNVYIALAKGGIVDEHFLICPIEHHQSALCLSDDVLDEIERYKNAIRSFYKRRDHVGVFFERNYKSSHMQVQAIPIPSNAAKEILDIFMDEAHANGIELSVMDKSTRLNQLLKVGMPYFHLELPNGETLYTRIESAKGGGGGGFPLNFAREVLATGPILNLPARIEWKECAMRKADEDALAVTLRKAFQAFDISENE